MIARKIWKMSFRGNTLVFIKQLSNRNSFFGEGSIDKDVCVSKEKASLLESESLCNLCETLSGSIVIAQENMGTWYR